MAACDRGSLRYGRATNDRPPLPSPIPPGYNREMDNRRWTYPMRLANIAILAVGIGMVIIGVIYVDPQFPLHWRKMGALCFYAGWATIGMVGGATLIYQVVHRINRRDDLKHAKRPPDPP